MHRNVVLKATKSISEYLCIPPLEFGLCFVLANLEVLGEGARSSPSISFMSYI